MPDLPPEVHPDPPRHDEADVRAYQKLMQSLRALEVLVNRYYIEKYVPTSLSQPAQTAEANRIRAIIQGAAREVNNKGKCHDPFYDCNGDCILIGTPCT